MQGPTVDAHESLAFIAKLCELGELLEAKSLSPARQTLYFEALEDLPLKAVLIGLRVAAKTCTFMPKPAEIRKLAVGDEEDYAERAWMAFKQAMSKLGSYTSLVTQDAAVADTIIAVFGGWPEACAADLSPEMWSSKRKEFGRVYRVLRDRGLTGARYLAGVCERQNAGRLEWQKYNPVGVIGTEGTCQRLSLEEAEQMRERLAAAAPAGLTPIRESLVRLLPAVRDEETA